MKGKVLPIDRGWAWMVVLGAFMQLFITLGITKSLGIIFVEIVDKYKGSASSTALMYSLSAGISLFCAPLITAACEIFSCRAVCMFGGTLLCIAFVVCSQSTSLLQIVLTYGFLGGLGTGCSLTPIPIMIGKYFDKKRALANGLAFSGTGLGSMVVPLLMYYIVHEFLLHGSMLFFAGFVFQTVAFASLYRPLTFYKNLGYVRERKEPNQTAQVNNHVDAGEQQILEEKLFALKPATIQEDVELDIASEPVKKFSAEDPTVIPSYRRQHSDDLYYSARDTNLHSARGTTSNLHKNFMSDQSIYFSALNLAMTSVSDIPAVVASEILEINQQVADVERDETAPRPTLGETIRALIRRFCYVPDERGNATCLFSLELLKNFEYMFVVGGVVLALNGFFLSMIVPPHSEDLKFTKAEAAVLLSAQGAADMCGRLFTAFIGDRHFFKPLRPLAFGLYMFGSSLCVFLIVSVDRYFYIAVLLICCAFFFGAFVALNPVLLADIVGVENLGKAWGIQLFFEGFTITLTPYAMGALKDWTRSYRAAFIYLGVSFFAAGVLVLWSAWLRWKHSKITGSPQT